MYGIPMYPQSGLIINNFGRCDTIRAKIKDDVHRIPRVALASMNHENDKLAEHHV